MGGSRRLWPYILLVEVLIDVMHRDMTTGRDCSGGGEAADEGPSDVVCRVLALASLAACRSWRGWSQSAAHKTLHQDAYRRLSLPRPAAFLTQRDPTPPPSTPTAPVSPRYHTMRLQVHIYGASAAQGDKATNSFLEIAAPNLSLEQLSLSITNRYRHLYPHKP